MKITRKKIEKSIKKSIEHWERMIAWVRTQDPNAEINAEKMENAIGESWHKTYCSLCQTFNIKCWICPLGQSAGPCSSWYSPWKYVNNSKTYGEWLSAAEEMLRELLRVNVDKYLTYNEEGYNGYGFTEDGEVICTFPL